LDNCNPTLNLEINLDHLLGVTVSKSISIGATIGKGEEGRGREEEEEGGRVLGGEARAIILKQQRQGRCRQGTKN